MAEAVLTPRGKVKRTLVPWPQRALDVELAAVGLHDVLDDGEAEAGAAELARARLVDAVEALGEPRQVARGMPTPVSSIATSTIARGVHRARLHRDAPPRACT